MKKIERVIDVNAHIIALTCDVNVLNGAVTAIIGFQNLAYGTITAIKFNAIGYNSFNDIVPINGIEKFFLIVQDISIGKNETAKDLKAVLPDADIRKLVLEECQICYADGSVVTYEGKSEFTYEFEEFDAVYADERKKREALQDKFGKSFVYQPQEYANGWICGCGSFNQADSNKCISCGTMKADAFSVCAPDTLEKIVEKYRIVEAERREIVQKEEEKKEKEDKRRSIKIGVCAVIAIIFAIFVGHSVIMSGRTTYSSEIEMKKALQGTYTYYSDSGEARRQIEIDGDTVTITWSMGDDMDNEVKNWNYKNGTFHTFENYTVLNNGDIKDEDGDLYKKGGYMSIDSSYTGSFSYESGYTVLDITDLKWDSNSSYTVCTGKVKNNGKNTYNYVKVKGSFEDSKGNVLDTDWTYAVGSEGLEAGESSSFRLSVDRDYDITDCSVSILDFD